MRRIEQGSDGVTNLRLSSASLAFQELLAFLMYEIETRTDKVAVQLLIAALPRDRQRGTVLTLDAGL